MFKIFQYLENITNFYIYPVKFTYLKTKNKIKLKKVLVLLIIEINLIKEV